MGKRHKAGDVFVVPIAGETNIRGQVLLAIKEQCIKPRLLPSSSPLVFYADALLLRITRGALAPTDGLLPPIFVWPGEWPITSHMPINPEEVDFPQGVEMRGITPTFTWGELRLPIDLKADEVRAINVFPPIEGPGSVKELALYALGRISEIDPLFKVPEVFSASRLDVRASPHRDRVHSLLGNRIEERYFETALRYGYDVRRFYGREHRERELVLCPYCGSPFNPNEPQCPVCDQDTRRDAPTEMTAQELAEWERVPCRSCRTPILKNSVTCPGCRQTQEETN